MDIYLRTAIENNEKYTGLNKCRTRNLNAELKIHKCITWNPRKKTRIKYNMHTQVKVTTPEVTEKTKLHKTRNCKKCKKTRSYTKQEVAQNTKIDESAQNKKLQRVQKVQKGRGCMAHISHHSHVISA